MGAKNRSAAGCGDTQAAVKHNQQTQPTTKSLDIAQYPAEGVTYSQQHREQVIQSHLAATPMKVRGTLAKAFQGKASPRLAIKAACLECCHYNRSEITDCRVYRCPLWRYRPYQREAHA